MGSFVVTGGSGFIGSHLCERLLAEGHRVLALDDLSTGDAANVRSFALDPRFELRVTDVAQPFSVDGPIDGIFHLASPASPRDFAAMQCEILAAGADGTRHGLRLAQRAGARFVLASTSEVYGEPLVHPQPEHYRGNVDSLSVRGVYDEAKRFAEAATMAWRRVHGVDARIVRIFNTYGPRLRLDDGRVLPSFLTRAVRGEPLIVHGDGSQTRSFCYVDDLVEGLVRAMRVEHLPEPVNLGNPDEVSIRQLAAEVCALAGVPLVVRHAPLPQGDPLVRRPDCERAERWLGFRAQTPRAEGLRRTLTDIRLRMGVVAA